VSLSIASSLYGAAVRWRRRWYAKNPSRQRHLSRPVISVGNLSVGGSGKTPIVEYLARLLTARGERPAILSRGYARREVPPGVTVVSDPSGVVGRLETAGDEPLMLARALPGVPVLVGGDRFLSGEVAEREFDVTVHILDDGFQHLSLGRDVDLLLVSEDDLGDRLLPTGRLREPLASAADADALLVTAGYAAAAERVGRALGVATTFLVTRTIGPRPERFFSDLASAGWHVAGTIAFRDHHAFDAHDIERIAEQAKGVRAAIVLTTEKDAVRLAACDLRHLPLASVPLAVAIDPAERFANWLAERIT